MPMRLFHFRDAVKLLLNSEPPLSRSSRLQSQMWSRLLLGHLIMTLSSGLLGLRIHKVHKFRFDERSRLMDLERENAGQR